MSENLWYTGRNNLSETPQVLEAPNGVSDQYSRERTAMANSPILQELPDSANSLTLNRDEIARQLLPLLRQFEATYDHADLVMTPLGEAFRRITFNAQYYAAQGGAE